MVTRTYNTKNGPVTKQYIYNHKQTNLGSKFLVFHDGSINQEAIYEFKHSFPENEQAEVMKVLTPFLIEHKCCTGDEIRSLYYGTTDGSEH